MHAAVHRCPCAALPIMAHNNSVQRTAPIPIAPKPPRPEPATSRQDSLRRFEIGPASLHARGATDSVSVSAPSAYNGQSIPPCRACRYSGSRCIPSEDDDGCMSCQVNAAECSLSSSSSPQSRKRKLEGQQHSHEISGKRRFVHGLNPLPKFTLSHTCPFPCIIPIRSKVAFLSPHHLTAPSLPA